MKCRLKSNILSVQADALISRLEMLIALSASYLICHYRSFTYTPLFLTFNSNDQFRLENVLLLSVLCVKDVQVSHLYMCQCDKATK